MPSTFVAATHGRHGRHHRGALRDVPRGARVLAVIPDRTRDDNTAILFPLVSQQLARVGAARLDALVAQGTHAPMADADKRAKIGWGDAEIPLLGEVFDHHWDRPETLHDGRHALGAAMSGR